VGKKKGRERVIGVRYHKLTPRRKREIEIDELGVRAIEKLFNQCK
jgi:hypothetical protein